MQSDILKTHPTARLRVYAIWTNKLFGELFVQFPHCLAVAPGFEVEPKPAHVLQVGCHLLPLCKGEGVGAEAAGFIDVALADVCRRKRSEEPGAGLDHLGVERSESRLKHVLRGSRLVEP